MSEQGEQDLVGRLVDGRYEVQAVLGRGGMGVVYRALHRDLERPVALKVIHRGLCNDPKIAARFRREARAASALGHPNIIDVYDFGRLEDGSAYLAMEFLSGDSLRAVIARDGALSLDRCVQIGLQVCAALDAAHENGVIHRDLKPDNILLTDSGMVKVVDFGIAKVTSKEANLTGTGELLGTPLYMSPEQCGGRDLDGRTDIYALGAILFEMLTGRPPFKGDSLVSIITQHVLEPAPSPTSINASVPPALERVVLSCLEKSTDDRPPSMRALGELLSASLGGREPVIADARTVHWAQHSPAPGTPASLPQLPAEVPVETPSPPVAAAPTPAFIDEPVRVPTMSRAPIFVTLAVLIAAGGGGVLAWSQLRPEPAPAEDPVPASAEPAPTGVSQGADSSAQQPGATAVEAPEGIEPHAVRVVSEPPGAAVLDGTEELGVTPLTVPAQQNRTLTLRAPERRDQEVQIGPDTDAELTVELEPTAPSRSEERSSGGRGDGRSSRRSPREDDSADRPPRRHRPARDRPRDPHPTNPLVRDPWGR